MYSALILAAGLGKRANIGYNKILYKIKNKPVLLYSIEAFKQDELCKEIIVVTSEIDYLDVYNLINGEVNKIVIGGKERQDSVYNGLQHVNNEYVLIHDGARPYLKQDMLKRITDSLGRFDACVLGVKVKDTLKKADNDVVIETLNRENIYIIQTPQALKTKDIVKAHQQAKVENFYSTDDVSLVEKYLCKDVGIILGDYFNIKLTTKEDILFLEVVL